MIVYGSMLFSLLSIIANTLTFCTQREIINRIGTVTVHFDITTNSARQNRKRIKELQREIADILEIDRSLIGIARPSNIRNGLRMEIEIYGHHNQDVAGLFSKYIQNGEMAQIIQGAWNLKTLPIVSKLNVERSDTVTVDKIQSEIQIDSMSHSLSPRNDITKLANVDVDNVYPQIEGSTLTTETTGEPEM